MKKHLTPQLPPPQRPCTLPAQGSGVRNESAQAELTAAWADLPASLKCHPGLKRLHAAMVGRVRAADTAHLGRRDTTRDAAQRAIEARDRYGWSVEADDALEALRDHLLTSTQQPDAAACDLADWVSIIAHACGELEEVDDETAQSQARALRELLEQPVPPAASTFNDALATAAKAVVDRWNSPQWEWRKHGPTAELVNRLRDEVSLAEHRREALSEDVRVLSKWLNEEPSAPLDRTALARVLARIK